MSRFIGDDDEIQSWVIVRARDEDAARLDYDPNQPRAENGQWGEGGVGGPKSSGDEARETRIGPETKSSASPTTPRPKKDRSPYGSDEHRLARARENTYYGDPEETVRETQAEMAAEKRQIEAGNVKLPPTEKLAQFTRDREKAATEIDERRERIRASTVEAVQAIADLGTFEEMNDDSNLPDRSEISSLDSLDSASDGLSDRDGEEESSDPLSGIEGRPPASEGKWAEYWQEGDGIDTDEEDPPKRDEFDSDEDFEKYRQSYEKGAQLVAERRAEYKERASIAQEKLEKLRAEQLEIVAWAKETEKRLEAARKAVEKEGEYGEGEDDDLVADHVKKESLRIQKLEEDENIDDDDYSQMLESFEKKYDEAYRAAETLRSYDSQLREDLPGTNAIEDLVPSLQDSIRHTASAIKRLSRITGRAPGKPAEKRGGARQSAADVVAKAREARAALAKDPDNDELKARVADLNRESKRLRAAARKAERSDHSRLEDRPHHPLATSDRLDSDDLSSAMRDALGAGFHRDARSLALIILETVGIPRSQPSVRGVRLDSESTPYLVELACARLDEYNPDQERDESGKWTSGGGGGGGRKERERRPRTVQAQSREGAARAIEKAREIRAKLKERPNDPDLKKELAQAEKDAKRERAEARRTEKSNKEKPEPKPEPKRSEPDLNRGQKSQEIEREREELDREAIRRAEEKNRETLRQQQMGSSPTQTGRSPNAPNPDELRPGSLPRTVDDSKIREMARGWIGKNEPWTGKTVVQEISRADGRAAMEHSAEMVAGYGIPKSNPTSVGYMEVTRLPVRVMGRYSAALDRTQLTPEVAGNVRQFLQTSPEDMRASLLSSDFRERATAEAAAMGYKTLIHESIHAHGPHHVSSYYGEGVAPEEISTEVAARRIVRDRVGVTADGVNASSGIGRTYGSYQNLIDPVVSKIRTLTGGGSSEAYDVLERAALRYKQTLPGGTPDHTGFGGPTARDAVKLFAQCVAQSLPNLSSSSVEAAISGVLGQAAPRRASRVRRRRIRY